MNTSSYKQVCINLSRTASIVISILCFMTPSLLVAVEPAATGSVNTVAIQTELKTVKLYGAGGVAGLNAYQSGFFVTADGHILTVWSTVLDVDTIIVITSDGQRMEAKVAGVDPNLEIAILSTEKQAAHFFDLAQAIEPEVGTRVLAFSNLYGIATGSEMSSLQKGIIMARTELNARRGSFASVYQGPAYVIDAMTNNPGAAGGALTDLSGNLIGMLGKELRDASANTWLNYAIPMSQLRTSIEEIVSGKSIARSPTSRLATDRPTNLQQLGIALVPNVLARTPAFVDLVEPNSPAAAAGLQSDDLILFVNSNRVASQNALTDELKYIDRADPLALLVQRGTELQEIIISP
jgi:S1-C subfamily serine protease